MQNPQPLSTLFNQIITPRHRYPDIFDQMRARVTIVYALFAIVASSISIISGLLAPIQQNTRQDILLGGLLAGILPSILIYALVHAGRLHIATLLTYVVLMGGAIGGITNGVGSNLIITLTVPMLYASLIWQWRGALGTSIIQTLLLVGVSILQFQGHIDPDHTLSLTQLPIQAVIDVTIVISIGFLSGMASGELRRAVRHTTRLITQLRATSEVAQRSSMLVGLVDMLQQTTNFIRDRFGFYHVQIFLNDDEHRFATLRASTGETGEALLSRGYRLGVGSKGPIGQVTLLGEPLNIDVDSDQYRGIRRDEMLPQTRSELVLPLIARERIIGALDIQSTQMSAFSPEDVESLAIMASHLSIAINNARIFQDQQQALNENRRLFLEAETNLREIQMLNQRLTGQAWDEYLRARSSDIVGYTLVENRLRHDNTWTPVLAEAAGKRQPIMKYEGDRQIVAVPVELRGRAIGAIEIETNSNMRQSDTLEMLTSVANRLALSIDNARLFEQAQELAQQELEVNAISAHLQGVTNMNELLKTAISELSRALGADQSSIRLGLALPQDNAVTTNSGNGKGH